MGLKQDLQNVVAAARLARERALPIRFVLMGDGSQRSALERSATGLDNLDLLPPCDSTEYPDVLAAADVLLVNERAGATDMSLPSKLTSYVNAGVPVVAAVPEDGATAREVRRSGAGVVTAPGEPAGLIGAIESLRSQPDERRRMGRMGRAYAATALPAESSLQRIVDVIELAARGATSDASSAGFHCQSPGSPIQSLASSSPLQRQLRISPIPFRPSEASPLSYGSRDEHRRRWRR